MSIVASCHCGKKFKAKDQMAGKRVRCPSCGEPVRIPGDKEGSGAPVGASRAAAGKAQRKSTAPAVDAEAALLKYEAAQKQKQLDAEAEAAYQDEKNKLIESYDQLTGRTKPKDKEDPKKKKGEFTEGPIKKVTIFNKIADSFATVFGTLLARYLIIVLLLAGGGFGSVILVQKVANYTQEETGAKKPREERIKELYVEARTALNNGDLAKATKCLNEVIDLDPSKEQHRTYRQLKKQLEKAYSER
ncbi:MAG: hypothetical protein MI923_08990 [Phycisphaerales bacterium]|nr:hypothetical protein [Phycisphaerales bacterium]